MVMVALVVAEAQEQGEAKANSSFMDNPTFLLIAQGLSELIINVVNLITFINFATSYLGDQGNNNNNIQMLQMLQLVLILLLCHSLLIQRNSYV